MWWKKKPECEHDWHKLLEKNIYVEDYSSIYFDGSYEDRVYIFCPKCKKRQSVTPLEWELREREQEILNQI